MDERQTLTVAQAARVLGIGRNQAYEAVRRGEIPSVRIGRRIVVPRAALERLLGLSPGRDREDGDAAPRTRARVGVT